jgi:hypothetical protein
MGQILTLHRLPILPRASSMREPAQRENPGSAARGILLALALSAVAWVGLALVVPRFW